ncbi:serine hydrolase domain-containing protein [Nocardioides sp. GXQ0305]|uniref:serine hydrolase domain-containing protein n=1 Tax=Nocardioides sp. GXQ0305 TaxID=3423912 RepID=UPI003D7D3865
MTNGNDGPVAATAASVADDVLAGGATTVAIAVADPRHPLVDLVRGSGSARPVLDVGSVTKVVVTAALHRRLGIDPDAPVRRWFPGLPHEVRVGDLLTHRAGLRAWWPLYLTGGRDRESSLAVAAGLPLRHAAGGARVYSDLGYVLAGAVAELVHDAPLDRLARDHVFGPLGMADSGYRPDSLCVPTSLGDRIERRMVQTGVPHPVDDAVRAAATTFPWRTHRLAGEVNDGNCWHAFGGVAGHAGLFTTAADLVAFGRELLDHVRSGGDPIGYWPTPGRLEHPGFPGARFAVLPRADRVVVLLSNRLFGAGDPPDLTEPWRRLVDTVEKEAR